MSSKSPQQIVKLLGGKLQLYRRPNTKYWWCCFYHRRTPNRITTRCSDLDKAKDFATGWFYERQVEIRSGIAPASHAKSFGAAAEKALEAYRVASERGIRSKSYLKSFEVLVRNNIIPALGKQALDSVNQTTWNSYKEQLLRKKSYKPATIHQHKNAICVVLKQAQLRGELPSVPQFVKDNSEKQVATPRTWFGEEEYKILILALRKNITAHKNTRWHEAAKELRDYVLFVTNSGLRVGEACKVRFCDVEITKDYSDFSKREEDCLLIRNILGKRGTGECKAYFGAVTPFLRCVARHGLKANWKDSEKFVFSEYHRDMFKQVLQTADLRFTKDRPPKRRDLMSLRHTYICFRLLQGVNPYTVAANCRTSVQMIENHYARWLMPSQSKTINRSQPKAVYNVDEEEPEK